MSLDIGVVVNVKVVTGGEKMEDASANTLTRHDKTSINVQISALVKALIMSEPCLFHNSRDNLMFVSEKKEKNNV